MLTPISEMESICSLLNWPVNKKNFNLSSQLSIFPAFNNSSIILKAFFGTEWEISNSSSSSTRGIVATPLSTFHKVYF